MSLRTEVVAALRTALPAYRITGLTTLDGVAKPTLLVWQESLTPTETFSPRVLARLAVWILVPQSDPGKADDALDAALEDVLGVVQPMDQIGWESAERGVLDETWHGYKLTVVAGGELTTT